MTNTSIYQDIAKRTEGSLFLGVLGPVRTGKSTFIKRFMETQVIPNIDNVYRRERAIDELPQSGIGKTVMTAEPKFVPEEAVEGIRDSLDCNLAFFGTPVGIPAMYAVLGLTTLTLVGLYILLHAVKKKTV